MNKPTKEITATNETESLLLKQLGPEPVHTDEICRTSGLAMPQVSSSLSLMEIRCMVKQVGGIYHVIASEIRDMCQVEAR